jgi:hypothetical protein
VFLSVVSVLVSSVSSAAGTLEVHAKISPLVLTKPLKAEGAWIWVYLEGGVDKRTEAGDQVFGFILKASVRDAEGKALGMSMIDSRSVGFSWKNYLIARNIDVKQIASVLVTVERIDTARSQDEAAQARDEEQARGVRTPQIQAELSPLVLDRPLTAEGAANWLYLRGAVNGHTADGDQVLSFTLKASVLNAAGDVLGVSLIDSRSTGFSFDEYLISQGIDARLIARIVIALENIDTVRRRAKANAEEAARARAAEMARQAEIQARNWPRSVEEAVIARKVIIGMTTEQVLAAWGTPRAINETISAAGTSAQWVYGDGQYLYFERGILTTIQRSR